MPTSPEPGDAGIAELLLDAGSRPEPLTRDSQDVMSSAHSEWRTIVQQQRRRQRLATWRIAVSLTLVVLLATAAYQHLTFKPLQVASISHVDGRLLAAMEDGTLENRTTGQPIRAGDTIRTEPDSLAALSFGNGMSLRLDHDTTLTISAVDRITLARGAVYVDAPPAHARSVALVLETPTGSVQHLGTQYEARARGSDLQVRVREGLVLVKTVDQVETGAPGQVLHFSANGAITRSLLPADDPYWQWTRQAGPSFDIENQSLSSFLHWIERETGRHVVFSTTEAESTATTVKLRGSIAGLDTDSALAAVLNTTQLRRFQADGNQIGIELIPSAPTSPPSR